MPRDEEAHTLAVESLRMVIRAEYLLGELQAHVDQLRSFIENDKKEHDSVRPPRQ